ncbi:MAG: hypothetical protein ACJ71Y_19875 [Blastococcus sp.]
MQPATFLSGTILGGRAIDVPARDAQDGRSASEAYSFGEIDLLLGQSTYDGGVVGSPSVVTMTCDRGALDGLQGRAGQPLQAWVSAYVARRRTRGQWFSFVNYRLVQEAPEVTFAIAAPAQQSRSAA